jgi:hypothetical protein
VEEDLTPEQVEGVTLHYADHMEDVIAVALPDLATVDTVVPETNGDHTLKAVS